MLDVFKLDSTFGTNECVQSYITCMLPPGQANEHHLNYLTSAAYIPVHTYHDVFKNIYSHHDTAVQQIMIGPNFKISNKLQLNIFIC